MNNKYKYLIIVFLIVASFIAFGRTLGNDFVNYDDDRLITENIFVQSGINAESIKWALTDSRLEYWHPLTWLSIMLNWRLFGANAAGHHFVSLLLHIGAVLFLFLFLNKATKHLWPSAFAAAFFALHPLRLESVAWAAEHKDVLSMFFGMATLYAYAYYVEKPQVSKYFLCLILFVLSLMSKPTLVTLPCVLLLLDYWPLARWQKQITPVNISEVAAQKTGKKRSKQRKTSSSIEKQLTKPAKSAPPSISRLLWEKAPFFLLSISLSIMLIVQLVTYNYMSSLQTVPFSDRLMNALVSYVSYLVKIFWPVDLAVFYPYENSLPLWQVLGAALVLFMVSAAVIYLVKRTPFLAVGWFWYLGTLFPLIGLLQAGGQSMADRYTYFPFIGIGIMLTWGVVDLLPKENLRKIILFPAAGIVLAGLTILTWYQSGYWNNSIALFSHALDVTKNNYVAHNNVATALLKQGKNEEAIVHYQEAIKINPHYDKAHCNLGIALDAEGKKQDAIYHYKKAININPEYDDAYYNLAMAFKDQGNIVEAEKNLRQVLRINQYHRDANNNLGIILELYYKKYDEAIHYYRRELKIQPDNFGAHYNIGIALAKRGEREEAIKHLRTAIYLKPDYEAARLALRMILAK